MAWERLTPLDASFLYLERPPTHMHVAGLSVFDPSTRPDPTRPWFEEIEYVIASRIHLVPRFRQKVLEVPGGLALPVWVDDPHFDLGLHLNQAALPAPGGRRELADLVQRALSRPLDRSRPLWELTVIEGLEGGLVATLMKVHHAMLDGIAAMQLAAAVYDLEPRSGVSEPPPPWNPEPEPGPAELLADALREQLAHPARALAAAVARVREAPDLASLGLGSVLAGVRSLLDLGTRPVSPLDVRVGPNRRFAMAEAPLERYRDVKNALGGTVNDVVLAVVGGALHRLLRSRGQPTRGRALRAMVPVSVRAPGEQGLGNRVAPAFLDIPVGAMSARRRLAAIRKRTAHLKESMMAMSVDAIVGLAAYAPGGMLATAAKLASRGPWFNLVVSNIPGPQQPLYLAGAKLLATYPSMPIGENAALSIACTSLGGTMAFGLTGDRDGMPDIELLAAAIDESLAELCKAAGV